MARFANSWSAAGWIRGWFCTCLPCHVDIECMRWSRLHDLGRQLKISGYAGLSVWREILWKVVWFVPRSRECPPSSDEYHRDFLLYIDFYFYFMLAVYIHWSEAFLCLLAFGILRVHRADCQIICNSIFCKYLRLVQFWQRISIVSLPDPYHIRHTFKFLGMQECSLAFVILASDFVMFWSEGTLSEPF